LKIKEQLKMIWQRVFFIIFLIVQDCTGFVPANLISSVIDKIEKKFKGKQLNLNKLN